MARGLPSRAAELDVAASRLAGGDATAREEVRRLAHKLRGIAGSYGFPELSHDAAEVEALARGDGPDRAVEAATRALAERARAVAPPDASSRAVEEARPIEPIAAPRPKAALPSPAPELEGLVVLAADDDDATRRLLEITLVQLGKMRGSFFDRGPALLEALAATERVDLVVVDAMMPDMNGLELLREVVARGLGRDARFAILSAAAPEELGWELPTELSVGWLRKPFKPKELLASLASLLRAASRG